MLHGSTVRLFLAVALTSVLLPGDLGATDCAGPPELVATSPEGRFKAVLPAREGQATVWRLSPDDAWEASHTVDLSSLEVAPHQMLIGDDGWLVAIERWCYGGGPLAMVWDANGKLRYRIDHDALPEAYRPTWHSQPAVSQLDETGREREALDLLRDLSAAFAGDGLLPSRCRARGSADGPEVVRRDTRLRSPRDRSFRATPAGRLFAQMGMWSPARLAYQVAMDSGRGSYYDELAYADALWCDGNRAEGEAIVARVLKERSESLGDHTRKSLRDKLAHGFQCVRPVRSSRAARREPPVISPSEPSIQPKEALRRLEEVEDRQGGAEVFGFQRSLIIHGVDPSSSDRDGLLRIVLAGLRDPSSDAAQAATWLAVKASLGTEEVLETGHVAVRAGTLGLGGYGGFAVLDHSLCFESELGPVSDLAPVP